MKSVKKKENCLEYQFLRLTKLINKKYQLYLQKTYARAPTRKKKKIIYIYILKNYEMYQKKIKLVSSYFKINKDSSCLKLIKNTYGKVYICALHNYYIKKLKK